MSLVTTRPTGTTQSGAWSVVGAANAHTALSDNSDSSYVQLTPRCRLDNDRMRVTFPAPSLPSGAQISSVGVRVRIQTVVWPAPQPQCLGWFRCHRPPNIITAIIDLILLLLFGWRCPQQPTTVWVTQTLQNQTSDPSGNPWTLASFNNFEVNLGRDDTNSNPLRISEVYVDVVYTQQSTVAVTAPTATINNTCRPTVTWTFTQPDANPQAKYWVVVYTAAQVAASGFVPFVSTPLQSSGWVFGTDLQWTLGQDITNGSYTAYVQVGQTWPGAGDFISSYASTTWSQSIAGAPNAILSSALFDSIYNRVTLRFTQGASSPTTVAYAVQVSRDSGLSWGPVRGGLLITNTGGTMTLYDQQAPLNVPSQYRVLAYGQTGSLLFAAAGYSNVISVTPFGTDFWVKDLMDPTMNTPLPLKYQGDAVTQRRIQGTFEVLSGDLSTQKVVVNGPQYGIEGTLTLIFHSRQAADYWAAFQRIDRSGHILLMQYPSGEQHFVLFGPGAVGSDMTWTYEFQPEYREVTVSYTEVAEPAITS